MLHHERYDATTLSGDLPSYNAALREFQTEQKMPPIDWTEQVSRRIGTTKALRDRELLGGVPHRLAFKLL